VSKQTNSILYLDHQEITSSKSLVRAYRKRIREQGFTGKTLFYKDEAQYQRKLHHFAELLRANVTPTDTLLDVGCGYGSLVQLLPKCIYKGIDIVPDFVSRAREQYPLNHFELTDIDSEPGCYDWCVLLGVVNTIAEPRRVVDAAWKRCSKGLMVDFIDGQKLGDSNFLNRFDIPDCLSYFLGLSVRCVEVRPTSDVWTIFIARKAEAMVKE